MRAGIAETLAASDHTSIQHRLAVLHPDDLDRALPAVAGQATAGIRLGLSLRAYVGLVEWTGRQLRAGKHAMAQDAPRALARYDDPERWAVRVKAMGSGYWRVVGEAQDLVEAAERLGQRWVKEIGLARALASAG